VDAVSRTDSTGATVGYPLYDAHGNRTATLTKSGSSFGLVDVRSYDAWGNVRYGSGTCSTTRAGGGIRERRMSAAKFWAVSDE
jgi:hypothetical protein